MVGVFLLGRRRRRRRRRRRKGWRFLRKEKDDVGRLGDLRFFFSFRADVRVKSSWQDRSDWIIERPARARENLWFLRRRFERERGLDLKEVTASPFCYLTPDPNGLTGSSRTKICSAMYSPKVVLLSLSQPAAQLVEEETKTKPR